MKYILITILIFFYVFISKAGKYINESSSSVKSEHINITKDLKSTIVNIENRWTDSYGEYGTGRCNGHILTENKKISLTIYCEQLASNGDKYWTQLMRDRDMKAGIGRIKYLNGTGIYEKFIGIECPYAVNYLNEKVNFFKQICEIPD